MRNPTINGETVKRVGALEFQNGMLVRGAILGEMVKCEDWYAGNGGKMGNGRAIPAGLEGSGGAREDMGRWEKGKRTKMRHTRENGYNGKSFNVIKVKNGKTGD